MPKDKERSINPAAAQRKAEKQRALKKGKAAVTAQRNERLAHRNPDRLQRRIDELKGQESHHGQLSQRDKSELADLERDVTRIRKAKQLLGDKGGGGGGTGGGREGSRGFGGRDREQRRRPGETGEAGQVLGKRGRGHQRRRSDSSATDDDVRNIPMPRDTPPPIPRRRRDHHDGGGERNNDSHEAKSGQERHPLPERPQQQAAPVVHKTTYEAQPVMRDLRKEAAGFVPSVVKRKLDAVRGGVNQPLMEAEELDKLEREGYRAGGGGSTEEAAAAAAVAPALGSTAAPAHGRRQGDEAPVPADTGIDEDEMGRFSNEIRHVQIEEVEDEDA